jgi:hypothetical protein
MPNYRVAYREVRNPETGKLMRQGEVFEPKTERGRAQAAVLARVQRFEEIAERKPVHKVAETKPPVVRHEPEPEPVAEPEPEPVADPAPLETADVTADDDAPPVKRGHYQTRRLKAKD